MPVMDQMVIIRTIATADSYYTTTLEKCDKVYQMASDLSRVRLMVLLGFVLATY